MKSLQRYLPWVLILALAIECAILFVRLGREHHLRLEVQTSLDEMRTALKAATPVKMEIQPPPSNVEMEPTKSKPALADAGSKVRVDTDGYYCILGSAKNISGHALSYAVAGFSVYRRGYEIRYVEAETVNLETNEVWKYNIRDVVDTHVTPGITVRLKRLEGY